MTNTVNAAAASVLLLALSMSCGPRNQVSCDPSDALSTRELAFRTDSLCSASPACEVFISVEYPTNATPALSYAIGEYVCESLGGTWEGSCTDYPAILKWRLDALEAEYRGFNAEFGGAGHGCYDRMVISKFAENEKYVSYITTHNTYLGGAHGSQLMDGMTFRKSDGRRIGWELFTGRYDEDFAALIKSGLMEYWNLSSEVELKEYFLNATDYYSVPRPECPPVFGPEGVTFIYNEYEIAAYALGRPQFTLSYDKLKPFMMVTARKLL